MKRIHALLLTLLLVGAFAAYRLEMRRTSFRTSDRSPAERRSADAPWLASLVRSYGPKLYSWKNEELLIRDYFRDRRGGVFLDVGAGPYGAGSNTYYLERHLGWSGVAIDAQREYAADYQTHRPRTAFFPLFVSDRSDSTATLFIPKDGRVSQASGERAWMRGRSAEEREVPTITLDDLLDRIAIESIDLLSMDIEFWEPKALAGFDIERFRPELVVIEFHSQIRDELAAYFTRHGYAQIEKYTRWDGRNAYYVPAADLPAFLARRPLD
jgi:FkbM family methyltransferase